MFRNVFFYLFVYKRLVNAKSEMDLGVLVELRIWVWWSVRESRSGDGYNEGREMQCKSKLYNRI